MPSSGGYGDPLDRDPALVLSDVLDGFTTIELAEHDFGVVIDSDAMQIDQEATGASAQRATAGSCRGRLRVSNRMRTRWLATDASSPGKNAGSVHIDRRYGRDRGRSMAARQRRQTTSILILLDTLRR